MGYRFDSANKSKNSSLAYLLLPSQLMIDNSRVSEPRKLNITTSLSSNKSFFGWFYNLILNRKHLIALISCELVSILGIAIGTKFFINQSLATQLTEQTKSELAVNDVDYHASFNKLKSQIELPLESRAILDEAVAANTAQIVTKHAVLGNKTYIMPHQALTNKIIGYVGKSDRYKVVEKRQSLAILVQRTPDKSINNVLTQSWLLQIVLVLLAFLLIAIWTFILRRSIIKPVSHLQQATEKFAAGDRNVRVQVFANDEIGKLAVSFNKMADSITKEFRRQENDAKLIEKLNQITIRLREVLSSEKIIKTAVSDIRDALQSDRVLFYSLDDHWQGKIIAKSVDYSWLSDSEENLSNPYFGEEYSDELAIGTVKTVHDIYDNNFSHSYLHQLESQAVKAYLLTPVFINRKLYGLLVIHQCSHERYWRDIEIYLFKQIAVQIGYALEQAELTQQIEQGRQTAKTSSWEEQQHQQALQNQVLELLDDVEGVVRGDLTVRADVNEGEIGTVADFFNSIVESLRDIIIKVKVSIVQLDEAIGSNETKVCYLTQQALAQTNEISRILDAVEQMTIAMQAVASSTQQAAQVANTVANTATKTGKAMDTTVENILTLREIVGKTAKKIKHLGQSTQEISRVIALINEISMQSNLLAINAGIEAERMGEESQGFVVVVEEVSELAARSAQATKEVAEIVENIQQETNEVVEAMQEGITQVTQGTQIVEDVKHDLSLILDISQQIDTLVQSISTATIYGVQTSQTVSELMKQVATNSQSTSESSMQVSKSLQKTVKISQQLQETLVGLKVN
ncbi:MAG: HAMP domain-containing protein [Pelatocladus maniniholoensis HA4357-MV3]|jgi:twitching motility protein PilJ|uniref:HAMP domain-containing protein n=1 Tax=Pelatocladus maniniholoensis HA4357-MV3 TaxID=1117104 RepID=A0A9E3HBJ5_9NOST|nr:HAMP domain-containing protein [Pelatocladus maniniholoensis HA4357-MV3]